MRAPPPPTAPYTAGEMVVVVELLGGALHCGGHVQTRSSNETLLVSLEKQIGFAGATTLGHEFKFDSCTCKFTRHDKMSYNKDPVCVKPLT